MKRKNETLQIVAETLQVGEFTPEQELEMAAENAAIAAEPGISVERQAERLIAEESALIAKLTPIWQLRAVARAIRSKRAEIAKRDRARNQFLLPGFDALPQRIDIRGGKRNQLQDATYRQLRDYFEVLRKRSRYPRRIVQLKALMQLVLGYARKTPGIKVSKVMQLEAERKGL
jgi:hypothetical protein